MRNPTLKEWKTEHPTINPFTNCLNVDDYGGDDLLYSEFCYRYGERELFKPDELVEAIHRIFYINEYKYERLYDTTIQQYDMFNNYKVEKKGSEGHNLSSTKTSTGSDNRTPNITETTTPNLSQNETYTPTLKTRETVTPTVKSKETDTMGVTTTTTSTPESYTDITAKTTYDDVEHFKDAEKITHTGLAGGTSTTTPSGNNTKITEVMSGNTITDRETVSGNALTVTTKSGTETKTTTGTDNIAHTDNTTNTGSDILSFTNRVDEGHMYREPQNAIKDERDIAKFAIINEILSDVEQITLLSIY